MPSVPNVKLNNGKEMPLVGFGLWKVNNDTCADTVYNAIKVGYRLFDGACDYGEFGVVSRWFRGRQLIGLQATRRSPARVSRGLSRKVW